MASDPLAALRAIAPEAAAAFAQRLDALPLRARSEVQEHVARMLVLHGEAVRGADEETRAKALRSIAYAAQRFEIAVRRFELVEARSTTAILVQVLAGLEGFAAALVRGLVAGAAEGVVRGLCGADEEDIAAARAAGEGPDHG